MGKGRGYFIWYGFIAAILIIASQTFCNSGKFIWYYSSGGRSPYIYAAVTIYENGTAHVSVNRIDSGEIEMDFALSQEKLFLYKTLVDSVNFFNLPEKETLPALDAGYSILEISHNGMKRKLEFTVRDELPPLINQLWQLIQQAANLKKQESNKVELK